MSTARTLTELDAATAYAVAWNTLDCGTFVDLLADGARYSSQYVFAELTSRGDISDYLKEKMNAVWTSGVIVRAELAITTRSLAGRHCVALYQGDVEKIAAVVLFDVEGGCIKSFDLCITDLLAPAGTGVFPGAGDARA